MPCPLLFPARYAACFNIAGPTRTAARSANLPPSSIPSLLTCSETPGTEQTLKLGGSEIHTGPILIPKLHFTPMRCIAPLAYRGPQTRACANLATNTAQTRSPRSE
eukprot:4680451-Amphidinium_carterae.1